MELWQLLSWLQSGHHVVNFSHLVGLQYLQDGSQVVAQNIWFLLEKELKVLDSA